MGQECIGARSTSGQGVHLGQAPNTITQTRFPPLTTIRQQRGNYSSTPTMETIAAPGHPADGGGRRKTRQCTYTTTRDPKASLLLPSQGANSIWTARMKPSHVVGPAPPSPDAAAKDGKLPPSTTAGGMDGSLTSSEPNVTSDTRQHSPARGPTLRTTTIYLCGEPFFCFSKSQHFLGGVS